MCTMPFASEFFGAILEWTVPPFRSSQAQCHDMVVESPVVWIAHVILEEIDLYLRISGLDSPGD